MIFSEYLHEICKLKNEDLFRNSRTEYPSETMPHRHLATISSLFSALFINGGTDDMKRLFLLIPESY